MEQNESQKQQQLQHLQDELQSLKARYGHSLRIVRKGTEGTEGDQKRRTPFPLQIAMEVQQPPPATYDIEHIRVLLTLDEFILDLSTSENDTGLAGQSGLHIRVDGANLPKRLRKHIADTLYYQWLEQRNPVTGDSAHFCLGTIFEQAFGNFVAMIAFFPDLLERYEGVNEDGATVRRVAILNDETEVTVDAAVQPPAQQPAPSTDALGISQSGPSQPPSLDKSNNASVGTDAVPAAEKELAWLQRRYGAIARTEADPAAAAKEDQLQSSCEFRLQMTPTDPVWDRGALMMTFAVAAKYPTAGSMQVVSVNSCPAGEAHIAQFNRAARPAASLALLKPEASSGSGKTKAASSSQQERLSLVASEVLAKLLTAYAARSGGTMPIMAAVRSLDSHGGQYAQQADDLALEVEAKRRQSAAAATSDRGPAPSADSSARGLATFADSACHSAASSAHAADSSSAASQWPHPSSGSAPSGHHCQDPRAAHPDAGCAPTQRRRFGEGLWWPSRTTSANVTRNLGASPSGLTLSSGGSSDARPHIPHGNKDGGRSVGTTPGTSPWGSSCTSDTYSTSSDSDSGTDSSHGSGEEGNVSTKSARQGAVSGTPGSTLTSVALEVLDLSVVNVDIVQPHSLVLQVVCARCRRTAEVDLPAGDAAVDSSRIDVASSCSACHHAWEVGVSAAAVHEASSVLASLWLTGCMAADLLPSLLTAQCSACSAVAAFRQVRVGAQSSRSCNQCNREMTLRFNAVTFTSQAEAARVQRQRRKLKEPRTALPAVGDRAANVGQSGGGGPLPDFGACSHYKHSHRWLRFPCCGARFACDLCHEESTDGHEMKWATRMVCGFCSLEQGLADRCSNCDKRLASSARKGLSGRSTRFWEGGKGCRDPKMLDRRDRRAGKQRGAKTQSQKDKRVGQVAKERREQRKEKARQ